MFTFAETKPPNMINKRSIEAIAPAKQIEKFGLAGCAVCFPVSDEKQTALTIVDNEGNEVENFYFDSKTNTIKY